VLALSGQGLAKGFAGSVSAVTYAMLILALGVSDGVVVLITVGNWIGGVVLALLVAYICDRRSRVVILGVTTLGFGASYLYLGLQPTVLAFVVMAFGQTAFGSTQVFGSPDNSLLADYYPPEVRGRIFALNGSLGFLGQVLFLPVAGLLVTILGWQNAYLVAGAVGAAGALFSLLIREPRRGRWDLIRLGASEDVASRVRQMPSLAEALRTVRAVRTLHRVCVAQMFLSATGVVLLPIILIESYRAAGSSTLLLGLLIAAQRLVSLVGYQAGGVIADRVLSTRPEVVMKLLGWGFLINLVILAALAFATTPLLLVPLVIVQAFVGSVTPVGQAALLSQVTPARVRTLGLQMPQFYGLLGAIVILPFYFVFASNLPAIFLVSSLIGLIGALVFLTATVDVRRDMRAARLAVLAEQEAADAAAAGQAKLLVCRGVDVHYDGVQVLFDVDLDVEQGALLALLGTNGAGKSTLLRAINGLVQPSGGAIYFDGRDITHAPAHELARLGIVQMPGGQGVFPDLSVADNLRMSAWGEPEHGSARIADVYDFFPALAARRSTLAGNLSGGEQQMLVLGQAMVMTPRLMLVDELSLGLAPQLVEQLLQALVRLHEQGTTIILVEQSVDIALSVAERAVFMEKGEVRFDGTAVELTSRPELLRSIYLRGTRGSGHAVKPRRSAAGTTVLEATGVSVSYSGLQALTEASLHVAAGEIVGVIGPNGAGKTTLFDALCGFVPITSGRVSIAGRDVTDAGPGQRAALGLARSFQDARLFPALTVTENLCVALQRSAGFDTSAAFSALWLPRARRGEAALRRRADILVDSFGLGDFRDKVPQELSTGTRRVLDLALMMAANPEVLLLDEPSSGIAQAEAEELGPLLDRIRRDLGCGVLLIEHDMSLLTSVADRLVGMVLGRTIAEGTIDEVMSNPDLVAAYLLGASQRSLARSGAVRLADPSLLLDPPPSLEQVET
jgi:ABC-type branched-subunit amino acid transport system ATPase component